MSKIKMFNKLDTDYLEEAVNNWLEENHDHILVLEIRFTVGEYGRCFAMVHYCEVEDE